VSDKKSAWTSWAHLKGWNRTGGLPVLPPAGALLELVTLVVLIVFADWAFPAIGFMSLEPSPFWLPVLLLSLQYGTVAGLMAAAAATAAYVFNGVAEQAVGENFFSFLLRIWALPILWIGVALVLGQFRLRQIASKQELRQDLTKRSIEAQTLAGYSKDLEARCQRLERQLTTRSPASVKPVLDALMSLSGPAVDISAALDVVTKQIWPGAAVSVFTVSPSGCELIGKSGWPAAAAWSTEFAASDPLYHAIVVERRPVSILNRGDENVLAGQGIAASPILTPDRGRVVGMLKIERIEAEHLDAANDAHRAMIAQLLVVGRSEPHVVVDNEPHASVPRSAPREAIARFASGWRLRSWRPISEQVPVAGKVTGDVKSDVTGDVLGDVERTAAPHRSS
jgi:polysaccharide biosynthesis protein PelD